ncbi:MAG TPA: aspartate aminotransferase family protein, partial [Verrucomicrobiales bacterium]|nr:aspartate aminotransferase family protein [Verrucomicrobiales bacterium]
ARGNGAKVWDTNGREYVDFTMGWGSVLTGHAHPRVVEAVGRAVAEGTNYAAVNSRSVQLAGRLREQCPCVEKIRFVASGTEATFMCLRIARAATGRRKVLKFEGAYHGQHPVGVASMVRSGETELPQSDPRGTGAPWISEDLLVAPFNDLAGTERILRQHASEIAGVIVEPIHRCLPPRDGFLEGLRRLTAELKIVLIFDEVVTGFRLAPGGAQEYYGVVPDLAAYGKALGGGLPLGAYGGRADLMERVSELRIREQDYVWSASTTGGNPVSCAAALATLDVLGEAGVYQRLHDLGARLRTLMRQALEAAGVPGQILGDGPLGQVAFAARPVVDQRSWLAADRALGHALMLELFRDGVYLNPMSTKLYVSLAHDQSILETFADRFFRALKLAHRTEKR